MLANILRAHIIFINDTHNLDNVISGQYSLGLVVVSVSVAILASYVAFAYSERYRTNQGYIQTIWLTIGSIVMGMGVWCMHFIGMMAYQLPLPVNYDIQITLLSMIPAILAAVAMHVVISKQDLNHKASIIGGILMGAGIGTMHYSGMMAMRFDGYMAYDPIIFSFSIVVAIILSIFALSLKHILEKLNLNNARIPVFCCGIMGVAISAMHYTGMASTVFISEATLSIGAFDLSHDNHLEISLIMAFAALIIIGLAFIGVLIDRRFTLAESQAKYSKTRLEAVMENVMDGIITINSEGVILDFNPAAEIIFGYRLEEIEGKKIETLMDDKISIKHDQFIKGYLRTGKSKVVGAKSELTAKHKDGHIFPIEIAITEMWIDGTSNFVASCRDISQRKNNEDEMAKMLAQQTKQATEASEANKMKSGFLANMSHELRTPLNVIMGITELLKDDAEMDGQEDLVDPLNRVLNSSKHLLQLINDILDLSKIEAGKIELHIEQFSFDSMLNDIKNTAELLAQKNKNTFVTDIADDLPMIRGDSMRLKQILLNLLSNSCKFTKEGTVTLGVNVEKADNSESQWIVFTVADTGIGMTEDQIGHLFQEFRQADSSTTKKFGGTGLGLAISKALSELMGGDIEVTSVYDEGSSFKVKLPLPSISLVEELAD